jgi:hypothetical protein
MPRNRAPEEKANVGSRSRAGCGGGESKTWEKGPNDVQAPLLILTVGSAAQFRRDVEKFSEPYPVFMLIIVAVSGIVRTKINRSRFRKKCYWMS